MLICEGVDETQMRSSAWRSQTWTDVEAHRRPSFDMRLPTHLLLPFLLTGRVEDAPCRSLQRSLRSFPDSVRKRSVTRLKDAFERSILTDTAGDVLPAAALSSLSNLRSSRHSSPCWPQPPHPRVYDGSGRSHGFSARRSACGVRAQGR
jgi:hypothetical protein